MKIKLLAGILFLGAGLWAQKATVQGLVQSKIGTPLPFVNLQFPGLERGSSTKENGHFQIKNIPLGAHHLRLSSVGYQTLDTTVVINKNAEKFIFTLQEASTKLSEVKVEEKQEESYASARLKSIEGVAIYAAKKNEVIEPAQLNANLSSGNARQVFARVPGVVIWESDCAGLQLGIGARGLSPNRTSNFNTRQNGYDIAADALGYPESYYTPPMQAIERVEIVRGAASLQYGTQFGGMINLKLKKGNPDKELHGKTMNTYNSVGFFNTYNELGGQKGGLNYFGYFNHRSGSCARPNSEFSTTGGHFRLGYEFNPRLSISAEYTGMGYLAQQPGGLTDFQFEDAPYQSLRSRNWFQVKWNLAALKVNYKITDQTTLNSRFFGLLGSREAVGYLQTPNRLDQKPYYPRDLLSGRYRNVGNETRLLHRYRLDEEPSALLVGFRAYRGFTEKTQGFGSIGTGPDFTLNDSLKRKSDYDFPSENYAVFAENIFNLTDRLSITPGIRADYIRTTANGFYDNSRRIPNTGEVVLDSSTTEMRKRARTIFLAGLGVAYRLKGNLELYSNFSQNYRAITFNDIRIVRASAAVDPNLQDENGFNLDLGLRGELIRGIRMDASVFWLSYQDRIGSVLRVTEDPFFGERIVRYTTNIADAEILGLESFWETNFNDLFEWQSPFEVNLFLNFAYTEGWYHDAERKAVENNRVETVPRFNFRTGLDVSYNNFSAGLQYSFMSRQFSEATNAETSPTGVYGLIPAFDVLDFSVKYRYKWLLLEGGVNNVLDETYFTRRATGYPGPGIIPSAPRSFYIGLGAKF